MKKEEKTNVMRLHDGKKVSYETEIKRVSGLIKISREPVNFGSVHKKSGVSKHFLYENKEVRSLIEVERGWEESRKAALHSKYDKISKSKDVIIATKAKHIEKLEAENKQLRKELSQLRAMTYEKK